MKKSDTFLLVKYEIDNTGLLKIWVHPDAGVLAQDVIAGRIKGKVSGETKKSDGSIDYSSANVKLSDTRENVVGYFKEADFKRLYGKNSDMRYQRLVPE